uniref:Uncharacterized protein n=1 Tax=Anguilla anguilla TaxID=7936 RepID=A0A0E9RJU6_ANGAN
MKSIVINMSIHFCWPFQSHYWSNDNS